MIIDRYINKYIVFREDSILHALEKMSANKMQVIFTVSERGELHGLVTDGDLRRWLVNQNNIDLHQQISTVANTNFKYCSESDPHEKIAQHFSQSIECVPLVDSHFHFVAVATNRVADIAIDGRVISENTPAFVIAEIGNNHNGSLENAKKLVDMAQWAGADCAKFQMRDLETLYRNKGDANDCSEDLGSQYILDLLTKFQLKTSEYFEIFDYCRAKGIVPLCTPWDAASVEILEKYGIQAYKVASADLTNHDLLTTIAKTHKPMFCSTGMSSEEEIREACRLLSQQGAHFILLHCNSTYPAPFKDVNLNYMRRLKEISGGLVGYSGHERGMNVSISAVALGAKVIEKHFTLDKAMEGNDHKVSLLPAEFKNMVQGIRELEEALGHSLSRGITQGEMINRESLAKSLVANSDIAAGETITCEAIQVRSPGKGLAPYRKSELIGRMAKRPFKKGDFFYPSDLKEEVLKPRNYDFRRPFGIPVRYHDVESMAKKTNMDILEFHLSYKDLEVDVEKNFSSPLPYGLLVHSPELFSGDHLLNLSADDPAYRARSISELQRVVDVTRSLKKFFPATKRPCIILNAGGFTADNFLPPSERPQYYALTIESLKQLDMDGVEIIPQTMPRRPWHFGGQRYHNLFVEADEIVAFCKEYGYRICFDVSHSKLACNESRSSFAEFVREVAPYTAHLHLADAEGVDGEGLQITDGDLDFAALAEDLDKLAPGASFIPEIWQGHKNDGEGFWYALDKLEKWF